MPPRELASWISRERGRSFFRTGMEINLYKVRERGEGERYAALGLGKGCDSLRELENGWFLGFEICTLESWF